MCCGPGLPLGQDRERRADRAIAAAVDDRSPLLVDATLPLVSCSHASSSRSSGRQLARCGEATPDAQQYRLRISKCCGTVRAAPPHLFPQCSCLGRRRRRRATPILLPPPRRRRRRRRRRRKQQQLGSFSSAAHQKEGARRWISARRHAADGGCIHVCMDAVTLDLGRTGCKSRHHQLEQ